MTSQPPASLRPQIDGALTGSESQGEGQKMPANPWRWELERGWGSKYGTGKVRRVPFILLVL
jgi:hypothetical protein